MMTMTKDKSSSDALSFVLLAEKASSPSRSRGPPDALLPTMKLLTLLIVAPIACIGWSAPSSADEVELLMLNVHSTNASTRILDTILSGSLRYLDVFIAEEPQYLGLGPGQEIPEYDDDEPDDRLLHASGGGFLGLRQRRRGTAAAPTRGSASEPRSLLLRSCPLTCAKSSSSSCKQLGCAYCGTSCRRRERGRNLLLSSERAARIEGLINLLLSPLCGRRKGCSIYSKIVRVRCENGTVVAEPLV